VVKCPLILTAGLLQIFENTENTSPSPKWGFQSPKFSDSDFRDVRGLGRPKSSAKDSDVRKALHRKRTQDLARNWRIFCLTLHLHLNLVVYATKFKCQVL
jgi:hypothetical protein